MITRNGQEKNYYQNDDIPNSLNTSCAYQSEYSPSKDLSPFKTDFLSKQEDCESPLKFKKSFAIKPKNIK